VSTLGLEPEPFLLITGTFNLFVKDRIAFRLSGAPSELGSTRTRRIDLSSKPFELIAPAQGCQLTETTGLPQDLHTREEPGTEEPRYLLKDRMAGAESTAQCTQLLLRQGFIAQRDAASVEPGPENFGDRPTRKRSNLKKDRLEVLAKPFEELCPRMRIPWPGLFTA
jgi:hypothetical protein